VESIAHDTSFVSSSSSSSFDLAGVGYDVGVVTTHQCKYCGWSMSASAFQPWHKTLSYISRATRAYRNTKVASSLPLVRLLCRPGRSQPHTPSICLQDTLKHHFCSHPILDHWAYMPLDGICKMAQRLPHPFVPRWTNVSTCHSCSDGQRTRCSTTTYLRAERPVNYGLLRNDGGCTCAEFLSQHSEEMET